MANLMVVLFYVLVLGNDNFCWGNQNEETIFLSLRHGNDTKDCGSQQLPCESINHAMGIINSENIRIYLDTCESKKCTYIISQTIKVARNVTIQVLPGSHLNNVMIASNNRSLTYMFDFSSKIERYTVKLIMLTVHRLSVARFESSGNIEIHGCKFVQSPRAILYFNNSKKVLKSKFEFLIHDSEIQNSNFIYLKNFQKAIIKINNCVIKGGTRKPIIEINGPRKPIIGINGQDLCAWSTFEMKNCVWEDLQNSDENSNPISYKVCKNEREGASKVFIENNTFIRTRGLNFWGALHVVVSDSKFEYNKGTSAITLRHFLTVRISNCTFNHNKGQNSGGACYLSSDTKRRAQINDCVFRNNSVEDNIPSNGGALYLRSLVNITNSRFIDNYAYVYGGNIYASYSSRRYPKEPLLLMSNVSVMSSLEDVSIKGTLVYGSTRMELNDCLFELTKSPRSNTFFDFHNYFPPSITNTNFTCPPNYRLFYSRNFRNKYSSKNEKRYLNYRCVKCNYGTYSQKQGSEHILMISFTNKAYNTTRDNINCIKCPVGGTCVATGLRSRDNFWGFKNKTGFVSFFRCPPYYCCSSERTPCTSYNTCGANRQGVLCGSCVKGFSENLIGKTCVRNENCTADWFWIVFLLIVMLYTMFFVYLKEIAVCFQAMCKKVQRTRSKLGDSEYQKLSPDDLEEPCIVHTERSDTASVNAYLQAKVTVLIKIMFLFYQMEGLIHINRNRETDTEDMVKNIISSIFNIKFNFQFDRESLKVCPIPNMSAVQKETFKIMYTISIFVLLGILLVVWYAAKNVCRFKRYPEASKKPPTVEQLRVTNAYSTLATVDDINAEDFDSFDTRLGFVFIVMLIQGYIPISSYCFGMLKCVWINDERRLFIDGDVVCYQWWQNVILIFTVVWVVPCFMVLSYGGYMLRNCQITTNQFYGCLIFPPLLAIYVLRRKCLKYRPVITVREAARMKHTLSVFDEPFVKSTTNGFEISWESVTIVHRLLLVMICVLITNPIVRLNLAIIPLLIFLIHHVYVQPYEDKVMNSMEAMSLLSLCVLTCVNMFWAYLYASSGATTDFLEALEQFFSLLENAIFFLPVLIVTLYVVYVIIRHLYAIAFKIIIHNNMKFNRNKNRIN